MWEDTERVACLLDGRVRTATLAAELRIDPATPAARAAALGYARLGPGFVRLLEGDFVVVAWSRDARAGVIACAPLGSRSLFLAERGRALLFASEVRELLAALPHRPPADDAAIGHWLRRTSPWAERTLYSGISRLPGGHAITLEGERRSHWQFWRPEYAPPQAIDAGAAAAGLRDALGLAVERALGRARRPGVLLSGGLDSAAVAAFAAPSHPVALSAIFPGRPELDESSRIRRVRSALALPGIESSFAGGSALAAAVEFIRTWELPPVSPNGFVWTPLLRRAADEGVDVLLDGEGGDEVFGCAPFLIADHLARGRPGEAVRMARRLPGMGRRPQPRWIWRALVTYGLRAALPLSVHHRMRVARGRSFGPAWLTERAMDDRWEWKRGEGPLWWRELAHSLTVDSLGAADHLRRTARMHGLEFAHPLRDRELIELMLRLPPALGFDPDRDRPLLRRALEGSLPREHLAAAEKPVFNSLLEDALRGPDAEALRMIMADPHPELARRVRLPLARQLLAEHASGARSRAWALDLWRLATIGLWLDHRDRPERVEAVMAVLPPPPPPQITVIER